MLWYYLRILVILFFGLISFNDPVMANNVLEAQKMLTKLGYAPGPIDGGYGTKTKNALENFYAAQNKKFDGELSENEISALTKASNNPDFSFEALKMMDDHVKQSTLLKVPMPSSNLVIKDYQRFRDYRLNHYKHNYSFTNYLWKIEGSSGQILDKNYCYETLAKFLVPATPNSKFKGRSETDFTRCQNQLLNFGVSDFKTSFKIYQKLFLEMTTSEKDHWIYRRSAEKNYNPNYYQLGGVIATFYMYYAVNYEAFNYTKKQRIIIENYFKKKAFAERFNLDGDRRTSLCPIKKPMNLNKRVHIVNNCGSVRLRFAAGELALAIVTQDEALWKKGLWDLDYALSMTNDEGFFVPLSAKGCRALGYTYDTSRLFSLNVEMLKLAGFDLLEYKTRHGKTISQAYEMLFKQYEDITISNHIAKKGIGSSVCGERPYKTHKEFLVEEYGTLDDGRLNDEWVPGFGRFINWSIRFASEKHPEWIKANTLREVETDPHIGNYHTVTAFEIYNANVLSEPKNIWKNKLKQLKELHKKKEEERKRKEAQLQRLEEEKHKRKEVELKRLEEEKRKREKAERQRKREMLFSYDGIYKIQLGQNRNIISGKVYQDLGPILFRLSRGQPKLDENNILYQAFGLDEINFSLDYDGYMTVSGQILSNVDTERKCVHLAGNLKSDKKFNPKSSHNCGASGQSLKMRLEKVSDDVNMDLVDEEELKKLDGEYDVQWFIKGINYTERTLRAKDKLTLSNGVGVFLGNDPNKQPSSELRKELLVQYNANGEVVILGKIDLMEKKDVKQWHASGKIHPTEKTTIKTVWGFGDIIELEIEKSKIVEVPKVIKPERLIDDGYFIYDEKNNSYQLNRHNEITGINQIDFSLSIDSDHEKLFNGDIAYSTSINNFETTWIDLKVNEIDKVSQNIKIGFVIEEGSFPNFAEPFSISKNECGVFEDMADDSFIIPLKTDNLIELELFDCHVKVLQEKLSEDDFGILKDRINTAISLIDTIEITNKYF
ncbi:peptidoglycan-binding protein [Amylibacter sp.]|nr:peptidoglycan-binding protein [Amylibacter sp.]